MSFLKKNRDLYFFVSDSGNVFSDVKTLDEIMSSTFLLKKDWKLIKILDTKEMPVEVLIGEKKI